MFDDIDLEFDDNLGPDELNNLGTRKVSPCTRNPKVI